MKSELFKTYIYELCLLLLIIIFTLFYFSRINRDYVESVGDNYTYELLAESVFSPHPFKVNIDFNPSVPPAQKFQQQKLPPLYPVLLAFTHVLFGKGMPVTFYLTCIIGALCAIPVFYIGKLIKSKRVGLLSSLVTLLMPALRVTSISGLNAPLFTFLSLWALYWLLLFTKHPATFKIIYAGLFSGLAYLTDYAGIVFVAVGVFVFIKSKTSKNKQRSVNIAIFCVSVLLVTSPWLIRNYLMFNMPILLPGIISVDFFSNSWNELLAHNVTCLSNIYHETGIMSLLFVYGLISGYFKELHAKTLLVYILGSLLIVFANSSISAGHFVHWLPAINVLGVLALAKFYQFRRYSSLQDYFRDNFWRQAFLSLSVFGIVFFGYHSYRNQHEADARSQLYPVIGNWINQTTEAGTVIMANPAAPIFYYARRRLVKLPEINEQPGLLELINEYQVEYIVALNVEQLSMIPLEWDVEQKFEVGKNLALVLKVKTD